MSPNSFERLRTAAGHRPQAADNGEVLLQDQLPVGVYRRTALLRISAGATVADPVLSDLVRRSVASVDHQVRLQPENGEFDTQVVIDDYHELFIIIDFEFSL